MYMYMYIHYNTVLSLVPNMNCERVLMRGARQCERVILLTSQPLHGESHPLTRQVLERAWSFQFDASDICRTHTEA